VDYMKGSKSRVKPLARPVDMSVGSTTPGATQSAEAAYERGYSAALNELAEGSTDMSRHQVLRMLESPEHASKHGKTIAKSLRVEWGME